MELFEEIKDEQYVWKGYYLCTDTECRTGVYQTYQVENVTVKKLLATGYGLNVKEEDSLLTQCKNTRIFTREIELAILSDDREMFLYRNRNGEAVDIKQLDVIGKYVYISENEVASPVYIKDQDTYTNEYFPVFKDYALKHHAETEGFVFDYEDKSFIMKKDDEVIMEMHNADVAYTYPFVLYVLRRLASAQPCCGFEDGLDVRRIRKLTITER